MEDFVKEITDMGQHLADRFVEKERILTDKERYSILKLAELCIQISRESGKIKKNEEA